MPLVYQNDINKHSSILYEGRPIVIGDVNNPWQFMLNKDGMYNICLMLGFNVKNDQRKKISDHIFLNKWHAIVKIMANQKCELYSYHHRLGYSNPQYYTIEQIFLKKGTLIEFLIDFELDKSTTEKHDKNNDGDGNGNGNGNDGGDDESLEKPQFVVDFQQYTDWNCQTENQIRIYKI